MIPKNLTILTLNTPDITDFAAARNNALSQAKTPWVLFLDTDEVVSPALESEIYQICNLKSNIYSAYSIPRLDTFLGRTLCHGETGDARFIRLARRDFGHWVRPVHEVWQPARNATHSVAGGGEGRVGELKNPLLHYPHPTLSAFLTKIDHYSTLEATYRYRNNRRSSLVHILIYPLAKFKYNYVWKLGFLDGVPGLIHALMMSFHSYLTWTKLFLLWHKK